MTDSPDAKPLIYCFSGSPYAWRALITLEEKGIDYDSKWIPRTSGEHRTPEMLALNPRGRLPILKWGDTVLYESMAICEFLDFVRPTPPLLPQTARERARALVLAHESAYLDSEPMDALLFALGIKTDGGDPEPRRVAYQKLHAEVARWEKHLKSDTPFLAGDALSLADIVVFPGIAFMVRTGLTLSKRAPRLAAWYGRLVDRPSVQNSWPPHWRETPGSNAGYDDVEPAAE